MRFAEVVRVLNGLEALRVDYWVAGGWGVAALAGAQTREHRDLDLAVDAAHFDLCQHALALLGYEEETNWFPVRVEFVASGRGWVDVHPVVFDEAGHGRQQGLAGSNFDYPPGAFTVGNLLGRALPCLSRTQQHIFHAGYEPRSQDVHDLQKLATLDGTDPPTRRSPTDEQESAW